MFSGSRTGWLCYLRDSQFPPSRSALVWHESKSSIRLHLTVVYFRLDFVTTLGGREESSGQGRKREEKMFVESGEVGHTWSQSRDHRSRDHCSRRCTVQHLLDKRSGKKTVQNPRMLVLGVCMCAAAKHHSERTVNVLTDINKSQEQILENIYLETSGV